MTASPAIFFQSSDWQEWGASSAAKADGAETQSRVGWQRNSAIFLAASVSLGAEKSRSIFCKPALSASGANKECSNCKTVLALVACHAEGLRIGHA